MQFLPKIARTLEVNLSKEEVSDILETKFNTINANQGWKDDFWEAFLFQRTQDGFQVSTSIKIWKSVALNIIATGLVEKTLDGARLVVSYKPLNSEIEMLFWIVLSFLVPLSVPTIADWIQNGFEISSLSPLPILIILVLVALVTYISYEKGVIAMQNEVYWALNTARSA